VDRDPRVAAAVAVLTDRDPDLARAHRLGGPFRVRRRPQSFETLVRLVVEQQLSLASAAAIMRRLTAAIVPFEPEVLLRRSVEDLRGLGLSRPKAVYCREVAEAVASGGLKLRSLSRLGDDAVVAALTAIKGIGPWTAEVYLLSALGRLDVWPAGDVALQAAAQDLFGLDVRPDRNSFVAMAERWRPYRSVAARILWQYYLVVRGRDIAAG
jgi:DNA-3-methyladenine glycosylase II